MEQTENKDVKSKRDLAKERLHGKYPEMDFENEDVLFGRINDDYDEYDNELAGYKEREQKFVDVFTKDPRSANFMASWANGEDPTVALIRQYGKEGIMAAIDDPARQEEIAAANKEFAERVAKNEEYEAEYQQNLDASLSSIDEWQKRTGVSDEEVDAVMANIVTIVRDGVLGKFTPETIDMVYKAMNHDKDVATASHEAEVRGRNEKIEEKLRKQATGDGTANLDGKNGTAQPRRRRADIFALADEAK